MEYNNWNKERIKIVFFVQQGADKFLVDIINGLSDEYETKKIIVTKYEQIDEGIRWADICWFEWCNSPIIYGSKLEIAKMKKIICRLHSYEAFTQFINYVNWKNIDMTIFVGKYIKDNVINKVNIEEEKTILIPNGIDINNYRYKERKKEFNIAYVGYINFKKGPMLLLHTFKAIYEKDNRYKLYITGQFQEERYVLYFKQMILEMGLENNIVFDGWQEDIDKWLEDKNYILCTSILESQNIRVMEAMSRGIKPIIHNFLGAKSIYPKKYIWNTIDEAVNMVIDDDYDSIEYRKFIVDNYSLNKQIDELSNLIRNLLEKKELNTEPIDKFLILKQNFQHNANKIYNTEKLFDWLLDIGDEKAYMKYLSEWFVRSNYDLTLKFKYYYNNMYRRFNNYSRFQYIDEKAYKKMESIGNDFLEKYYDEYFKKCTINSKKKQVLFILNGLDFYQIVNRHYLNLINKSSNENFQYHILSLLCENEFRNSTKSVNCIKNNEIDFYTPKSNNLEKKVKEFYKYISSINPDVVVFQSFYFAPLSVLIYPLLKKLNVIIGRIVHQQPENYFDKRINFVSTYLFKDPYQEYNQILKLCQPIDINKVDKNLDIKEYLNLDQNKKVMISIGREIKYKDKLYWKFIVDSLLKFDNLVFVVFGCSFENFKHNIPQNLIDNKKIFLCKFNLEAASYLKSCDLYVNSPLSGGRAFTEAYYAELPIVTFCEKNIKNKYSIQELGYSVPGAYYSKSEKIFPKPNDYDGLLKLLEKILKDKDFLNYYQNMRCVKSEDMKFESYCEKFEGFLEEKYFNYTTVIKGF